MLLRMLMVCLCCSTFLLNVAHAAAADDDNDDLVAHLGNEWYLSKDDQSRGIKTWIKLEDGKRFRSFKIEMTVPATMDTLARVLFDYENYPRWFWEVTDARLLKVISPTEHYLYMVHRAPMRFPSRDTILHTQIEPTTLKKNYALLKIEAAPSFIPLKPPLVRMPAEQMTVKITRLDSEKLFFEAEGYVDPGGVVPVWATNFVQRSAPYAIAVGILRMVKLPKYRDSKEPAQFAL